ncbi:MAG: GNAT family N-acetyltransferase [Candidatus Thorarchaeota archaeon]|jgi:hypothetical protein
MGFELCLPKKLRRWDCDRNRTFYEVEPDVKNPDYEKLTEVFKKYWEKVYPEDANEVIDYGNGRLQTHEATLAHYWASGCFIRVVKYRTGIIGFLVYQIPLDGILLIKGLYSLPDYTGFGLGKGLVNSLNKPIKKVLFQTRKGNPPAGLLYHVIDRATKVHEDHEMITWEMKWEAKANNHR